MPTVTAPSRFEVCGKKQQKILKETVLKLIHNDFSFSQESTWKVDLLHGFSKRERETCLEMFSQLSW